MRHRSLSITWHGQAFHFERLNPRVSSKETALWAVSRRGEFIGTMPCSPEVTTKDFEVRGLRWLRELLGSSAEK
jgi:hypothetical protein